MCVFVYQKKAAINIFAQISSDYLIIFMQSSKRTAGLKNLDWLINA